MKEWAKEHWLFILLCVVGVGAFMAGRYQGQQSRDGLQIGE